MEKYLRLNEQCGGEGPTLLSNVVWDGREKGQTNEMQGMDCNPLFWENCNHPVVPLVGKNSK